MLFPIVAPDTETLHYRLAVTACVKNIAKNNLLLTKCLILKDIEFASERYKMFLS